MPPVKNAALWRRRARHACTGGELAKGEAPGAKGKASPLSWFEEALAGTRMPTLIRLVVTIIVLAVVGAVVMVALAYLVEPTQRETIVEIPRERLQP